jgi:lipopolysaccharide biosynthesis glycosyltransferase
MKPDYGLVFAIDENYITGAETMMASVLRHNPWFKGDWIVIADKLSQGALARLRKIHPLKFVPLDPVLARKARGAKGKDAALGHIWPAFFALQLFSFKGYKRLVYLDVDMLCLGDISSLFFKAPPFGVVHDDVSLDPWFPELRSRFAPHQSMNRWRYGRDLAQSFNSGMMTVSSRHLGPAVYKALLADPYFDDPRAFMEGEATADQFILNRAFGDVATSVGCEYNWSIYMDELMRSAFRKTQAEARVIHYAGMVKPWLTKAGSRHRYVHPEEWHFYSAWHQVRQEMEGGLGREEALRNYRQRRRLHSFNMPWMKAIRGRWRRWLRWVRL